MSLYVGDRVVCIPAYHTVTYTYTKGRIETADFPDGENSVARNV